MHCHHERTRAAASEGLVRLRATVRVCGMNESGRKGDTRPQASPCAQCAVSSVDIAVASLASSGIRMCVRCKMEDPDIRMKGCHRATFPNTKVQTPVQPEEISEN